MSREPRSLGALLNDIISWGERISPLVEGLDYDEFATSDLHQLAVIKCIEAIGEAAGSVRRSYPDFAAENAEIAFEAAYRARNRLSHGYDSIDLKIVWDTATISVPLLIDKIKSITSGTEGS